MLWLGFFNVYVHFAEITKRSYVETILEAILETTKNIDIVVR
jgi:hypothetical protein